MGVVGEVGDWKSVGDCFDIPESKLHEIKQQPTSEQEKSYSVVEYLVNTMPDISWKKLAEVLYEKFEERAVAVVKQYLPKGMCISWPPEIGLFYSVKI